MGEEVDWSLAKSFRADAKPLAQSIPLPTVYGLGYNYPNPFNPSTTITYKLPEDARVTLAIYDILGREVVKLVNGLELAGKQLAVWNGRDRLGNPVAAGIYIYRLQANHFTQAHKMVLLK